jgi:DNA excision repair protein ERCC-4
MDSVSEVPVCCTFRPQYVILFEPEMALIRQIEIFKARHKGQPLRVYLTVYKNSIEEQKFKSAVKKEQEAFEKLIKDKATMVVPVGQDGKSEMSPAIPRNKSTRKGVGALILQQPKVLIDTREFRSKLPSLMHARGIEVVPLMLDVGDYVLSKDVCVERKSIMDLYQSFSRGRLYNQIELLCRAFQTPILLIEFSENQSFCLQNDEEIGFDIETNNILSKLVLLTIHFPKLKLIWSKSPYETVEIFLSLKENKPEPSENDIPFSWDDSVEDLGVFDPVSILRRLPGINENNIKFVTDKVQNLAQLTTMTLADLGKLIGEENAQQLTEFLDKTDIM